jgi:hypothetical protein
MVGSNEENEVRCLMDRRRRYRDMVEAAERGHDDLPNGARTTVLSRPIRDIIAEADYD